MPVIVSQSKEAEADTSIVKLTVLGLFGAAANFLAVYEADRFFVSANGGYAWGAVAAGVFFGIFAVLASVFVKNRSLLKSIVFLWSVIPLVLFTEHLLPEPSLILIGAAIVTGGLAAAATARGAKFLAESVEVQFFGVAKNVLPKAVTAFLLMVSALGYLNYFEWGGFNRTVGQALVDEVVAASAPAVSLWLPGVSVDGTVDEFLKGFALNQLRNIKPDVVSRTLADFQGTFNDLPAETRTAMVHQVAGQLQESLGKLIGPMEPETPFTEAVYAGIVSYAAKFPQNVRLGAGALLALLAFGSLKGIAALFYWLIEFLAFLAYKFLLLTNFAHVATEMRSRKFVVMS
ncbi:MAG: hypothetical protein AAB601_03340 [Patescibacteria group bacterium]